MIEGIKRFFGKKDEFQGLGVPDNGRSSVESVNNLTGVLDYFNGYYDIIDRNIVKGDVLETMLKVCVANPDVSQAVRQWVTIGNRGHDIIVDAANQKTIDRAIEALNESAYKIYQKSAGVDGLFNHYLWQLGVFGAVSSEDVIAADMSRVENVATVSPRFIRFKLEDGIYKPYQMVHNSIGSLIPLNEITYTYFCHLSVENSPYGLPPALAALDPLHTQKFMHENVKFISEKMGLTGFTSVAVTPPPRRAGESNREYTKRASDYLQEVLDGFKANYRKGLAVHANDIELTHTNTTGDARGAYDIHKLNEEQIFSGINNDPAMHGRSYSTTETYADVVYNLLIGQANSFRRLVKRRHEKTLRLDLALRGIMVNDVTLQMAGDDQRDTEKAARTDQIKWQIIKEQVESGAIDPDEGAQRMGYDNWYDVSKIGNAHQPAPQTQKLTRLRFNARKQQYDFIRPRIVIRSLAAAKTPADFVKQYLEAIWPIAQDGMDETVKAVMDYLANRSYDANNVAQLAEETFGIIKENFGRYMKTAEVEQAVKDAIAPIYSFYRLTDTATWPDGKAPIQFVFDTIDTQSMHFIEKVDQFYLSKFIENSDARGPIVKFLQKQYLEDGDALFGRTKGDSIERFRSLFSNRLEDISDKAVQRILDTSVQRMRNWGHIGQLDEAGIEYARPVNPSPEAPICVYVTSQNLLIPVGTARQAVNRLANLSADEYRSFLESTGPVTPEKIQSFGIDTATAEGIGFPPYHPHCHTVLEAVLD